MRAAKGKGVARQVISAICLRTRYAIPGTDAAYCAICLRTRYAIPGTVPAYHSAGRYATPRHSRHFLVSALAMRGADIASHDPLRDQRTALSPKKILRPESEIVAQGVRMSRTGASMDFESKHKWIDEMMKKLGAGGIEPTTLRGKWDRGLPPVSDRCAVLLFEIARRMGAFYAPAIPEQNKNQHRNGRTHARSLPCTSQRNTKHAIHMAGHVVCDVRY